MKLVAVSQRIDLIQKRNELRDSLDQRLIEFLQNSPFLCIPVPNGMVQKTLYSQSNYNLLNWLKSISPNAIILSGGNNIGTFISRDKTEKVLIDYALKNRLPLLGICRGMQMISVWAGTKLKKVQGHVKTRHKLSGKIQMDVNSYNDLALTDCPKDFEVLARSEDGEIEAINHNSLPWEGWMWHPEREPVFNTNDIIRLNKLLQ